MCVYDNMKKDYCLSGRADTIGPPKCGKTQNESMERLGRLGGDKVVRLRKYSYFLVKILCFSAYLPCLPTSVLDTSTPRYRSSARFTCRVKEPNALLTDGLDDIWYRYLR